MHTNMRFDTMRYDEEKIVKETVFRNQQFDQNIPSFMSSHIQLQESQDEIDYLQFGQQEEQ